MSEKIDKHQYDILKNLFSCTSKVLWSKDKGWLGKVFTTIIIDLIYKKLL